jgi:hypothetical protein
MSQFHPQLQQQLQQQVQQQFQQQETQETGKEEEEKKPHIPKCEPCNVEIDVCLKPVVNITIDQPKINVTNKGRCTC